MTKIRCKFQCLSKEPAYEGATDSFKVKFGTVYDPNRVEDEAFTKYTPSGTLEALITNPAALAKIEVGKSFYVDLTPVDSN